jgi:cytochrome c5
MCRTTARRIAYAFFALLITAALFGAPHATGDDAGGASVIAGDRDPRTAPADAATAVFSEEELTLLRRWTQELARRQDRDVHGASYEPAAFDPADTTAAPNNDLGGGNTAAAANNKSPSAGNGAANAALDPAVISVGQSAFQSACTTCHDAARSTSARKGLGAWMSTVRRMAGKEGADVSESDIQPIATYLASLNPAGAGGAADSGAATPSYSLFSTVSLSHRSGAREEIENEGFFPEVWLGAEWHPEGPLSARVHACVTCHTEIPSQSNRIELAEGFFRLDLDKLVCNCPGCEPPFQAHIDAGRFIVPFGAFAAQSHPGAYRTATRPLMYNMGQNLYRDELPAPLLPMPYSDEGVVASATLPLTDDIDGTLDVYGVNGLQGSTQLDISALYLSRDYVDNNTEPALGGRATIGNNTLRAGASLMSGRFNENTTFAIVPEVLNYKIYGADLVARWNDRARLTLEYARRDSDALDFNSGLIGREAIKGTILEGEVQIWDCPKVSAVVRYDDQRRTDGPLLFGPFASPEISVRRFTYGLNFALGSSTLMVNHEHWNVPQPLNDLDVLAIRWVASF